MHAVAPEGDRLHDVAAAPDAAVADDLDAVADGVGHRRHEVDGGGRRRRAGGRRGSTARSPRRRRRRRCSASATVWMPLTTIGPSHIERSQSMSRPRERRVELRVDVVGERDRGGAVARRRSPGDVGEADRLGAHEPPRPARVDGAVEERVEPDLRRQREAAAHVALAPAEHRGVDGEHERLVARAAAARSIISSTRPRSRHT